MQTPYEIFVGHVDPSAIEVRQSEIHNVGVFAKKDLPKGTFIVEYVGPKIDRSKFLCQLTEEQARYAFKLDHEWTIDGSSPENVAGRINHSCAGNCSIVTVDGHIWVVAERDICKGEELGYNYGYKLSSLSKMEAKWRCNCRAPNCVGFILRETDWPTLKRKLQEREEEEELKKKKKEAVGSSSSSSSPSPYKKLQKREKEEEQKKEAADSSSSSSSPPPLVHKDALRLIAI